MNLRHPATHWPLSHERYHEVDTRLHGRWLILTWIVWLALVVPFAVPFLAGLPGYRETLYHLNPIYAPSFRQIGITVDFFSSYYLGVVIADLLICWSVAALILWRKSSDWIGLLTALMLVFLGMQYIPLGPVLGPLKGYLSNVCVFLFFCLFPNGRFVPHWIRWLLLVCLVWDALLNFTPFNIGYLLGGIGLVLVGIAAQFYRYRSVSTSVQQQQIKWAVFGITLGLLLKYATYVPVLFFPALGNIALLRWLNIFVFEHFFLCIPLSIGIALLRYRLWDIEILINRTLVYGTLTASLAFVYFGLIFAVQSLLRGLINQNNEVAIVVSTLAIYALFQPLRRRIQNIVDRRFYRRKYDAARILAAFSATLRHEVDVSRLSEDLVAVVQETMQPAHISLWLRPTATNRKAQATWSNPPPAP
jgi:hypothetical protein